MVAQHQCQKDVRECWGSKRSKAGNSSCQLWRGIANQDAFRRQATPPSSTNRTISRRPSKLFVVQISHFCNLGSRYIQLMQVNGLTPTSTQIWLNACIQTPTLKIRVIVTSSATNIHHANQRKPCIHWKKIRHLLNGSASNILCLVYRQKVAPAGFNSFPTISQNKNN